MPHPRRPLTPNVSARHKFGAVLQSLRDDAGLSQNALGELVHYSGALIAAVEKAQRWPTPHITKALDQALHSDETLTRLLPLVQAQRAAEEAEAAGRAGNGPRSELDEIAQLRREVADIVVGGALTAASLDDWERTVAQHGRATRYKPAGALLRELLSEFAELRRLLEQRRAASTVRALTRNAAQLAGLMALTLIKLGRSGPAREWARTARLAADEAADPCLRAWVRAQESYIDYYCKDPIGAVATARAAQTIPGAEASVGAALAAALEARAYAALGDRNGTAGALARAEHVLSRLPPEFVLPSAFGYNEAQLQFHAGNAWTRLGDINAAAAAHQRALELYPEDDYLDRALVRLDQARCMAAGGDPLAALTNLTRTVTELDAERREGLVALCGQELLLSPLLTKAPSRPAQELQELLVSDSRASQ